MFVLSSVSPLLGSEPSVTENVTIDINDLGDPYINIFRMWFIRIEPGTFQMGSENGEWYESPAHKVTIPRPFYIQREEVTARQYALFDPTLPAFSGAAKGLSWHEARAFADWVAQFEGLPYRLPTEAEWEYACRAGTTTPYSSGDQQPPSGVPNAWGVTNMHNWPAEWVLDWHGEYSHEDQVDPMGPAEGIAKVVRGGGLDDGYPYYMRSASRVGIGPGFGGRDHLIGFRLVIGELPATGPEPYEAPFVRQCIKQSTAQAQQGPDPNIPYYNQRPMLPIPPENTWGQEYIQAVGLHPSFRGHNHSPGMEVCPNGDVLMVIYTSWSEYEPGVSLMGARLRFGSEQWDMPCPMFDFVGANDHAPMLWNDNGTLHFFWGCPRLEEVHPNPYPFQWTSSQDNGATWDEVKFPVFEGHIGSHSRQPINTALRGPDGTMYVSSDGGGDNSVLWASSNNGQTWYDTGGRTGGRHTTFVLLNDGRILGMGGKNTGIQGYMPKSISANGGLTWNVSPTPFCMLGSNQRPCIARLASGRLFFCSDFQRTRDCYRPPGITEMGALAALSEDEGQTWLIKKIPTALRHESRDCEGATLGYSVARQAGNGIIHVITSMNHPCQHFEMNEAWILDPGAGGDLPPDPGETGTVSQYREDYPGGATKATWGAKVCEDGRYLLHGTETWYYEDGRKQYEVTYYNGRKVGSETYWGLDGAKKWSWEHDAGGTSIWRQWWPNALKHIESTWSEGGKAAHGPAYHWSMCGTPELAWDYYDGWFNGTLPLPGPQVKGPDLVDDGIIDHWDLDVLAENWLASGPGGYNTADLNCDGEVGFDDYAALALHWLESSP
jgi:hypothetical protein